MMRRSPEMEGVGGGSVIPVITIWAITTNSCSNTKFLYVRSEEMASVIDGQGPRCNFSMIV
jgi:hypothetical protein